MGNVQDSAAGLSHKQSVRHEVRDKSQQLPFLPAHVGMQHVGMQHAHPN